MALIVSCENEFHIDPSCRKFIRLFIYLFIYYLVSYFNVHDT